MSTKVEQSNISIKKQLNDCLTHVYDRLFSSKLFKPYIGDATPSLDCFKENSERYNLFPKSKEEWYSTFEKIEQDDETLDARIEGATERIESTLEYLSKKNSFLFLNVGSFHIDVYEDGRLLEYLDARINDDDFHFLATSAHSVMKNKKKNNPFLNRLIYAAKKGKGTVIDLGDRVPLHFISTVYQEDGKGDYKIMSSFEHDHDEEQVIRLRIFPNSILCNWNLYKAQITQIISNNQYAVVRSSVDEYKKCNPKKTQSWVPFSEQLIPLLQNNLDGVVNALETIIQRDKVYTLNQKMRTLLRTVFEYYKRDKTKNEVDLLYKKCLNIFKDSVEKPWDSLIYESLPDLLISITSILNPESRDRALSYGRAKLEKKRRERITAW